MASSNKITLERIDHGVLPKKKNRIHRRGIRVRRVIFKLSLSASSAPRR